jgi:hypothetical protein
MVLVFFFLFTNPLLAWYTMVPQILGNCLQVRIGHFHFL